MSIVVEPWLEDDDPAWDALCAEHDEFFQTSAVTRAHEVFGARTRRVRVLGDDGRPLAAVALLETGSRRVPAADALFARRLQILGGPLPLAPWRDAAPAAGAAIESFAATRRATETDWKPTWPATGAALDLAARGWDVRPYGVAWRTLPESAAGVEATLARPHRKAARKAERDGVSVREARDLGEVRPLVDASFRRSGLEARAPEYLVELDRGLRERGAALALVAEDAEGPVAALLAARCGRAVFNLFHGRRDGATHGASNLLHLRLFEQAVERGATRVHTGDAALPGDDDVAGITQFKRWLGFQVEPCVRGTRVHRPASARVRRGAARLSRILRGGTS